jgi:hypothetical protein
MAEFDLLRSDDPDPGPEERRSSGIRAAALASVQSKAERRAPTTAMSRRPATTRSPGRVAEPRSDRDRTSRVRIDAPEGLTRRGPLPIQLTMHPSFAKKPVGDLNWGEFSAHRRIDRNAEDPPVASQPSRVTGSFVDRCERQ